MDELLKEQAVIIKKDYKFDRLNEQYMQKSKEASAYKAKIESLEEQLEQEKQMAIEKDEQFQSVNELLLEKSMDLLAKNYKVEALNQLVSNMKKGSDSA